MSPFIESVVIRDTPDQAFRMRGCTDGSAGGAENALELSKLRKITLLVGPTNSGKSRLLRSLFHHPTDCQFEHSEMKRADCERLIVSASKAIEADLVERQTHCGRLKEFKHGLGASLPNGTPGGQNQATALITTYLQHLDTLLKALNNSSAAPDTLSTYGLSNVTQDHMRKTVPRGIGGRDTTLADELAGLAREVKKHHTIAVDFANGLQRQILLRKIYIPTLRGLRMLKPPTEDPPYADVLRDRTHEDYFKGISPEFLTPPDEKKLFPPLQGKKGEKEPHRFNMCGEIFTGQTLYSSLRSHLLDHRKNRERIREFEEFLSRVVFDKEITLVPSEKSKTVLIAIGPEERPVHEFGDGIQHLIIMTYPLFMARPDYTLALIEEPELFLHPGLQRKLLEALLQTPELDKVQVVMTTHSNHFLDMTLESDEIATFRLARGEVGQDRSQFHIEDAGRRNRELLMALGVRSSSVYLSNATIWVEGPSDCIYIKAYLDAYMQIGKHGGESRRQFKEDLHYSFLMYGGSNLKNWELGERDNNTSAILADALCSRAFLTMDSDLTASELAEHGAEEEMDVAAIKARMPCKQPKRAAELSGKMNGRLYVLPCCEMENSLPSVCLLPAIVRCNHKDRDSKPKTGVTSKHYQWRRLGEFIEKDLFEERAKGSYAEGTGTMKSGLKTKFAAAAAIEVRDRIHCDADLGEMALDLCGALYSFIQSQNPSP